MTTETPRRRSGDREAKSATPMLGVLLAVSVIAAVGATVGAMTADPDYRVLLRYVAGASALMVFAMAGLYAARSERRSSDVWQDRLGGGRAPGSRNWLHSTLAFSDFKEELRREVSRSRRSERPCSVLLIEPESVEGFDDNTVQMFTLDRVATTFRTTDLFGHAPRQPGVIALLPETDGEGAGIAAVRLRADAPGFEMRRGDHTTAPLTVRVAAATYPEDGTDADSLLEQLGVSPAEAALSPG